MLIGVNHLVLTEETVRQAIEEYMNARLVGAAAEIRVIEMWYVDGDNMYEVHVQPKSEDN